MILIVAIFAAQPVMACCLTGHADVSVAEITAEPPCHGDAENGSVQARDGMHNASDPFDCPGCRDCDTAIMEAQVQHDWTVLTSVPSDDVPVIALEKRFPGFEPRLMVLSTGPPRDISFPLLSPVSLKQRLLI